MGKTVLSVVFVCRSQRPGGLRRRSASARLLRSLVRIPPGAWMFVCCECFVLSGISLCDQLITRPEESYRLWCVVVRDLETWRMRRSWPALGRSVTGGGINNVCLSSRQILWQRGSCWVIQKVNTILERTLHSSDTVATAPQKYSVQNSSPLHHTIIVFRTACPIILFITALHIVVFRRARHRTPCF